MLLSKKSNPLIQKRRNNTENHNAHDNQVHLKELWVRDDMVGDRSVFC